MKIMKSKTVLILLLISSWIWAAIVRAQVADPTWIGTGKHRVLVRVDPVDIGQRSSNERPAEVRLSVTDLTGDADATIDLRSVRVVRYALATGKPILPREPWAYGDGPWDIPFRWYDQEVPYDFPEMEGEANSTPDGRQTWTPRTRWGYFYDVVGDWKSGQLVWMHTQEGDEPSYYAVYFDVLPEGSVPRHAEPRGWVGDGLHRTVPESNQTTGLIHTRIDLVDFDGDGLTDIVAGCSRGGIVWYKNIGTSEQPDFGSARMLFTTDGKPMDVGWTSSPKVVDWTGNGVLDILSGAEWNRVVLYENIGTNEDKRFIYRGPIRTSDGQPLELPIAPVPEGEQPDGSNIYKRDYYPVLDVADYTGDGQLDLIAGGYVTGRVYLYKNTRQGPGKPRLTLAGPIESDGQPIDVGWAASPLLHDFTGDGKPELIVGNMKMTAGGGDTASAEHFLHYYENIGDGDEPCYVERGLPREGQFPRAALGTPRAADINGDGLVDLIVSTGTNIYIYANIGTTTQPQWRAHANPLTSEWGNAPLAADQLIDWNGDGLLDQAIGHSVAINTGKGNPGLFGIPESILPPGQTIDHRSHIGDDWVWKRLFDLDGDGRIDAMDADHAGHVWFHRNGGAEGSASFDADGQRLMQSDGQPICVGPDESAAPFDILQGARTTYSVADMNNDGRPDLVVGNYIGAVRYYEQLEPAGDQLRFTPARQIEDVKNRFVPFATDWDGDGWADIIAAASAERFMFIRNLGNDARGSVQFASGVWQDLPGAPYGAGGPILVADFNGDGDDDLILQTAYSYTVWVERSFLEKGYATASLLGLERRGDAERARIAPRVGTSSCAYPTIDRLSDGRLLCVYSTWRQDDRSRVVIAGTYSDDHGKTWSEPVTLIDSHPDLDYDPNIVVMGESIFVSSTTVPPTHGQFISTSRTIAVRSDDNGQSWSKPYEVPMGYRYTSGKIHNGIMLPDGTALFGYSWDRRLQEEQKLMSEGDEVVTVGFMLSDDKGRTWRQGPEIATHIEKHADAAHAISGLDEPALARCPDGSIYMLARTGRDRLYASRSLDNGRTWTEPKPSLVSHNAPAALCAIEGDRPGILAVWNHSDEHRWPLSVAVSFDNGETWSPPRDLIKTPGHQSSYPGCVQAADGSLVVVWQQDHPDRPRTIESARFDLDWLLGAEQDTHQEGL